MLLRCGCTDLDLSRPVVMGVLNVTPDSFSDGGRYADPARALEQALRMVEEGAAIIDVGGESTRPGAPVVAADEELRRVLPILERPEVIRAAHAAGANLINDVRALSSPGALEAAAATDCAVCLVHMQGEPAHMQHNPSYGDVVSEVKAFLLERVQACRAAGIGGERVAIDPGFGFGKTLEHNLTLLRRLPELASCGLPLLLGMSRKSSLAALTGRPLDARLPGSLALAAIAVLNGARIVRAHDVAATLDAVRVAAAVRGGE
jgi:dihydropteroate synthase